MFTPIGRALQGSRAPRTAATLFDIFQISSTLTCRLALVIFTERASALGIILPIHDGIQHI